MDGWLIEEGFRPRLVFGYADSAFAVQTSRFFRRLGWEVHLANSAAQAHNLIQRLEPQVAIFDVEMPDETGWLACAKTLLANPDRRVFLVTDDVSKRTWAFADYIGAGKLIRRDQGIQSLAAEILGPLAEAV